MQKSANGSLDLLFEAEPAIRRLGDYRFHTPDRVHGEQAEPQRASPLPIA